MAYTATGIRIPANDVPMHERLAFTLPEAAKTFGLDYETLLAAANCGDLITFRPRSRRNTPGWRHVTRDEMNHYLSQFEE